MLCRIDLQSSCIRGDSWSVGCVDVDYLVDERLRESATTGDNRNWYGEAVITPSVGWITTRALSRRTQTWTLHLTGGLLELLRTCCHAPVPVSSSSQMVYQLELFVCACAPGLLRRFPRFGPPLRTYVFWM